MGDGEETAGRNRDEFSHPGSIKPYRKIITALEVRPIEGTNKTLLVKKELLENPDRYCLPTKLVKRVIQDLHLIHMHLGMDGII